MSIKFNIILTTTALVSISATAAAEQRHGTEKYEPRVEIGGKLGSERNIGAVKMMAPLYQTDNSMIFTDIRGRLDDSSSEEYNIGVGYRQVKKLGDADVIVGGYGFYDHLSSELGNDYSQVTLGLEAMTEVWDVRANAYIPEDDENATGAGTLEISGGSIGIRGGLESALSGFDAEVGYKLPISQADVRVYGGGFYFSKDGFDTISGPSGRVEMTVDERQLNFLPSGSEITIGLEAQYDDVREDQYFALAEFRLPLSFDGKPSNHKNLSAIDRRMTKFVERDVDIVTSAGGRANTLEDVVINGVTVDSIATISASEISTGDEVQDALTAAGQNSLFVVDGSDGLVTATGGIILQDNQLIVGGGTKLNATGATSGIVASRTLAGTRPTIDVDNGAGVYGFVTADNNYIDNLTITGASSGVAVIQNDSNVTLNNISNTGTPLDGIFILGTNGNVNLNNLNITATETAVHVNSGTTANLSLNNSILTSTNGVTDQAVRIDGTVTNLSGANNTLNGATDDCDVSGTVTNGSFTYGVNNANTCP